MADYTAIHARALAQLGRKGVPMTFTRFIPGSGYDPATDGYAVQPVTTTISGNGIVGSGSPEQYAALSLVLETTPLLKFVPSSYPLKAFTAAFVQPGDTVQLNGAGATVVKVLKVVAPDGGVILSDIAVST